MSILYKKNFFCKPFFLYLTICLFRGTISLKGEKIMPKKTLRKTLTKNKTMSKREYIYRALLAIVKLEVVLKPVKIGISHLRRRLSRGSAKDQRASLRRAIQQTSTKYRYSRPVPVRRGKKGRMSSERESF